MNTLKTLNIHTEPEQANWNEVYRNAFVDITKPLKKQPIALSFGTNFGGHAPIVSYGDFSSIVGASKSMKTFLKSAFEAGYIGGKAQNYFQELRGHDTTDKLVVSFDTEQSEYHVKKAGLRVMEMVGHNYESYKPFALRPLSAKERIEFIEHIFYEKYKNIGLATIDGAADLVNDVNDLKQSNEIVQRLMKITEKTKSAIITVIHRNYESDKPTGHLGSAILKKCQTVLFVKKQNNIVEVESKYSRDIPFENFSFTVEDGIPQQLDSQMGIL